jgi:hypothetical protein
MLDLPGQCDAEEGFEGKTCREVNSCSDPRGHLQQLRVVGKQP